MLQSYLPEHPVIEAIASGDREAFYEREIKLRQNANLPPFARFVSIIISGTEKKETEQHARALKLAAPKSGEVFLLGPAEAPMAMVRGRHRYRLLVHTSRAFDVQAWMENFHAMVALDLTSVDCGGNKVGLEPPPIGRASDEL